MLTIKVPTLCKKGRLVYSLSIKNTTTNGFDLYREHVWLQLPPHLRFPPRPLSDHPYVFSTFSYGSTGAVIITNTILGFLTV